MTTYNIAIDGPAGAGKSTIARKAAARLGFIYVDTGAMYRAMALYFLRKGIDRNNEKAIKEASEDISITINNKEGTQRVLLNGEDVSGLIRTEEVSQMTSAISVHAPVREKLLELQRELANTRDVIMDGRDIGTCVLPNAQTKIYLTASSHVRALRRFKELEEKGLRCNLEEIEHDIIERDYRDTHRAIAPLKQAEDAVYIDSSQMTIDQVVEAILEAAGHGNPKDGR